MKKQKTFALFAVLSLAVLLALLLLAESGAPGATIVSVPSALWYLLTTLTTVGYGDCYPVTAAGRVIGAVFQLMSLGVLGLMLGLLAAYLRGTAWETLRLLRYAAKTWYVFSEKNEASLALAAALKREDPRRILLFAGTRGDCGPGKPCLLSAEAICSRKKDGDFRLFCLSEDEQANERLANSVNNGRVYCRSSLLPDKLPDNQQRFDPKVLCARRYWDRFPLESKTETVLLAGDGAYAAAILEQGLLRNVLDPAQHVSYVCAGDWSGFLRLHPDQERFLEIDPAFGGKDSLLFLAHWNDDPALLQTADRIVFCGDNEEETRRAVADFKRCFAVPGAVQARLSVPVEQVDCFGAADEIFTPELVMQEALSACAMALNERYRNGNQGAPAWNELSDFARRSNLAAADHLQTKLRLLTQDSGGAASVSEALERFQKAGQEERDRFRRIEHARWCRFHVLNGWRYAERRDNQKRLHPMLLPFDRLSAEEQAKDDNSWELLRVLQGGSSHEN